MQVECQRCNPRGRIIYFVGYAYALEALAIAGVRANASTKRFGVGTSY